jgi:hypothetical protein
MEPILNEAHSVRSPDEQVKRGHATVGYFKIDR